MSECVYKNVCVCEIVRVCECVCLCVRVRECVSMCVCVHSFEGDIDIPSKAHGTASPLILPRSKHYT